MGRELNPSAPVAVLAAGLKAPGGNSPDALFAALCAGVTGAAPWPHEQLTGDAAVLACTVTDFDPHEHLSAAQVRRSDRCHQLAIAAAAEAWQAWRATGAPHPAPERCGLVCGVGWGAAATIETQHQTLNTRGARAVSPLTVPLIMPSSVAAQISLHLGFRGPALTVSTACASGAMAIGEGAELIRRGAADVVIAGGVDALVTLGTLAAFLRLGALSRTVDDPAHASRPFDVDRDGFVLGEGAGFVVLGRAERAEPLGYVHGYGTNADAHHLVAPAPDGSGALRCMRLALTDAGAEVGDVGHVNAHGTGTPLNDAAEARALLALLGPRVCPVTSTKGTTGHLIGGSGAVEAIMTLWSLRSGILPPVAGLRTLDPALGPLDVVHGRPRALGAGGYGLSNSFGFGGVNASLLLGRHPSGP